MDDARKRGGDPAYPVSVSQFGSFTGMTMREAMATAALQGILANGPPGNSWNVANQSGGPELLAHTAVLAADALLAELEKSR